MKRNDPTTRVFSLEKSVCPFVRSFVFRDLKLHSAMTCLRNLTRNHGVFIEGVNGAQAMITVGNDHLAAG